MKNICKYSVIALCILASVMTTGCIGKKKTIDESSNTKQAYNKRMSRNDIKDGEIVNDENLIINDDLLIDGKVLIIRKGKKKYYMGLK